MKLSHVFTLCVAFVSTALAQTTISPATQIQVQRYTVLAGGSIRSESGTLFVANGFVPSFSEVLSPDVAATAYGREAAATSGKFITLLSVWLSFAPPTFPTNYLSNYQRSTETYTILGVPWISVTVATTSGGGTTGGGTVTPTPQGKFSNLSTRGFVGSGGNLMIVGIVVADNPKKILIRAIGPTLTAFGLTGVLSQPILEVFDSKSQVIFRNTGWGTQPAATVADIKTKSAAVGAFAIPDNSNDSVLLVTLQPGNYSVQIKGVNDGTGVAIAEVYEAP